ncbi:MAG: DUF1579 domain-containing protein [Myxococcota bacterium]
MDDGRGDFDFLFGRWQVQNRRLARRLVGDTTWEVFDATAEVRPILGGLGNYDALTIPRYVDGAPLNGGTVRVFDPRTRSWRIWWVDDRQCEIQPPVVGRFEGDRGSFFGDDTLGGRPIRVWFDWRRGDHTASWSQAFSADGGATWETNWEMTLTRAD